MMQASHMNPEEAVQAAVDLGARRALGMHFGTFDLSDEPLDEPPRRFLQAATDTGLGTESAWILSIGETRRFADASAPLTAAVQTVHPGSVGGASPATSLQK